MKKEFEDKFRSWRNCKGFSNLDICIQEASPGKSGDKVFNIQELLSVKPPVFQYEILQEKYDLIFNKLRNKAHSLIKIDLDDENMSYGLNLSSSQLLTPRSPDRLEDMDHSFSQSRIVHLDILNVLQSYVDDQERDEPSEEFTLKFFELIFRSNAFHSIDKILDQNKKSVQEIKQKVEEKKKTRLELVEALAAKVEAEYDLKTQAKSLEIQERALFNTNEDLLKMDVKKQELASREISLQKELSQIQETHAQMTLGCTVLTSQIEAYQSEISSMENSISELTITNEKHSSSIKSLKEGLKSLYDVYSERHSSLSSLESQLEVISAKKISLDDALVRMNEEHARKHQQFSQKQANYDLKLSEYEQKKSELQEASCEWDSKLSKLSTDIQLSKLNADFLAIKSSVYTSKFSSLEMELLKSENSSTELSSLISKTQSKQSEYQELQNQNFSQKIKKTELQREFEFYVEKLQKLTDLGQAELESMRQQATKVVNSEINGSGLRGLEEIGSAVKDLSEKFDEYVDTVREFSTDRKGPIDLQSCYTVDYEDAEFVDVCKKVDDVKNKIESKIKEVIESAGKDENIEMINNKEQRGPSVNVRETIQEALKDIDTNQYTIDFIAQRLLKITSLLLNTLTTFAKSSPLYSESREVLFK